MNTERNYFLRSSRLGFSIWGGEDFPLASGLWGDPEVTRYIDARDTLDAAAIRERLDAELAMQESFGIQYWPIFALADNSHVGCCGLRPRDGATRTVEFGVHLRRASWRQGYALEAARAAIQYAFDVIRVKAIFAGHNPQNTASAHLLDRIGFLFTHNEFYQPTGLDHPSYLLDRERWTAIHDAD